MVDEMDDRKIMHGGDIYRNKADIDFSVSITPLEWPEPLKSKITLIQSDVSNIYTYPDEYYEDLMKSISRYTGEASENIVCGNGASELINSIFLFERPKRVLIPVPCYSGYERAASVVGAETVFADTGIGKGFSDFSEIPDILRKGGTDLLIIGNPSNPSGGLVPLDVYEELVRECEERGTVLVIDECFTELSMTGSEYRRTYGSIRGKTLIRLRALTKSFRLAGIRLGYAICEDRDMASGLRKTLPEWNISTPAMKIGAACCDYENSLPEDKRYLKASKEFIYEERRRVSKALEDIGVSVFESSANYILIRSNVDLYGKLLSRGILIRDCSNIKGLEKGYYRISLRDREDNDKLLKSIRDIYYET